MEKTVYIQRWHDCLCKIKKKKTGQKTQRIYKKAPRNNKNQLTIFVWPYFQSLYSIVFVCLSFC